MKIRQLHRRAFLRGAAGTAIALPFLDAMRPTQAHASSPPPFLRRSSTSRELTEAWRLLARDHPLVRGLEAQPRATPLPRARPSFGRRGDGGSGAIFEYSTFVR